MDWLCSFVYIWVVVISLVDTGYSDVHRSLSQQPLSSSLSSSQGSLKSSSSSSSASLTAASSSVSVSVAAAASVPSSLSASSVSLPKIKLKSSSESSSLPLTASSSSSSSLPRLTIKFPKRARGRRRFPVLKAIVSSFVKRKSLDNDSPSSVSSTSSSSSSASSSHHTLLHPSHLHHPIHHGYPSYITSDGLIDSDLNGGALESIELEVIKQEELQSKAKPRPTRSRKNFLVATLTKMLRSVNFTQVSEDLRIGSSSKINCLACNSLMSLYLSPLNTKEVMVGAARVVCKQFSHLMRTTERVCLGVVESFADDLDYIRRSSRLTHREMCGLLLGVDCVRTVTENLNWTIPIPNKPQQQSNIINRRSSITLQLSDLPNQRRRQSGNSMSKYTEGLIPLQGEAISLPSSASSSGSSLFSSPHYRYIRDPISLEDSVNLNGLGGNKKLIGVVHLTDIHIDPYYQEGAAAACGEPLCCRSADGKVEADKMAGKWGDYRSCDTPIRTVRHALKHISENHPNARYWMWTGDIAPHDVWNITRKEVISQIKLITNMFKRFSRVPVYPVIGNHESVPVNSFAPPEVKGPVSISWLYDVLAQEWSYWLPDDAVRTLRYGGYYTVKVRPGFRITSINTNYCTRLNPWTLYNPIDPGSQLKWLVDELYDAENSGDKVHIIGHVPPDDKECTQAWLFNYLRIIDRFSSIVLAQYFGHTHHDEFRVLYSPYNSEKPTSMAYIGPSITPYTDHNPAYRVYHTDNVGFIKDHETIYFNLTEANLSPLGPQWRRGYTALDEFDLHHLGPEGWDALIDKLDFDDRLFQHFYRLSYRFNEAKDHCNLSCKKSILKELRVTDPFKKKPKSIFASRRKL
ncbi:uncharacterized protein LOC107359115 [Tetranychus urticae]|uniref:Calcineurin-like phosphoesterase domain-containing protein n=1 Tax=Tetranychus urticae TaxID=32264 RepID=T1K0S6_TETUR|nr:uncharacterized protein LOC107359115 [Tetranychus urticae]